ncbi:methylglyoxal synthase [Elstera sp.]|jgi:methylglyoxal synthase|uniref:methylglyoxal synthase n=1 Tax=Elstera sp. TaxID=1916664 RepID=UPI0037BFD832
MMLEPPTIALLASPGFRQPENSPLSALLTVLVPFVTHVCPAKLVAMRTTYEAAQSAGFLTEYPHWDVLPPWEEGSIATVAARLVDGDIDWVIYLADPGDLISLFPESIALKRQCVVHGRPFLATVRAASEWCLLQWIAHDPVSAAQHLCRLDDPAAAATLPSATTLGLVAHDTRKAAMLGYVETWFPLLDQFRLRLSTGTTGGLLNGQVPERLGAVPDALREQVSRQAARLSGRSTPWTTSYLSGPKGGDAQIADRVLREPGATILFFEDPHVAREHEADIQLLERIARLNTYQNACLHDPVTAQTWAELWTRALESGLAPTLKA